MRKWTLILSVVSAVSAAAGSVHAAPLHMPGDPPQTYASYTAQQDRVSHGPQPVLTEKPVGELIAAKLGVAEGSAELFQYQVDDTVANHALLDGVVDGGGVKLKLTW